MQIIQNDRDFYSKLYSQSENTRIDMQNQMTMDKNSKIKQNLKEYKKVTRDLFENVPLTDKELKSMILSPQLGTNK